ncbi:MAG: ribokinase [Kiritimatiellia bacterium]|nr:ribokinase [Kiritimatiellia bacterium]
MKILNYGSLNIDRVYQVPHIAKPGETISSQSFLTFAGGKGANQSVAIARAGGRGYQAGKVGWDGKWLVKKIAGFGVNTRFIRITKDSTGQAVIQIDKNGENAIFLHPGTNHQITQAEIDNVLGHFSAGDVLLLQNEINAIDHLIHTAYEQKMRICLNPAPMDRRIMKDYLRKVNMLILNETEGAALSGEIKHKAILDSLAKKLPESEIILTLGKQGALARLPGQRIIKISSVKVKSVDTTAAGDTFIGYYLAGRVIGKSPGECLRQACRAAAICVTRPGAMDSIPSIREVRALMRNESE